MEKSHDNKIGVSDAVMLPGTLNSSGKEIVSEESFLENLQKRFEHDIIYTFIGDVIVSVNPFKKMPNLYGEDAVDLFQGKYYYNVPPHVFALTEDAYRDMLSKNRDQCVIVSGESGAGKTEASKLIMQYIAAVSSSSEEVNKVKDIILKSNPILEAFGNAKTNRNNNSSRFGKYMDIQFNLHGDPVGGHINNYLLEKSRVIGQSKGERSFHIMYQLLKSGLSYLNIGSDASKFHYLNQSDCDKVDGIDDANDFKEVREALTVVGLDENEIKSLFSMVAGIMNLGNVNFTKNEQEKLEISNSEFLKKANELFQTTEEDLKNSLIYRTVVVGNEHVKTEQTIDKAINARDALSKELYSRVFSWLVEKINQKIKFQHNATESTLLIGVLDIYGFEVFDSNNGFEQFCINYCNEKLQQLFISLTLKQEQEEYREEGIEWTDFEYFNNDVILELIEDKRVGLISSLDEECLRPGNASDKTFLAKMDERHAQNRNNKVSVFYESRVSNRSDKTIGHEQFRLKHYAGDVVYDIEGFLDKNMDNLSRDIKFLFAASKDKLVECLFPDGKTTLGRSKRMVTTATSFKSSLNDLIQTLLSKKPHYIRCIKSNDAQQPDNFDKEVCTHQVRYLGLLENVRVRRAGYVFRQSYEQFLTRYRMVCPALWPKEKVPIKRAVEQLLTYVNVPSDGYKMGKTKVFIKKPDTIFSLEERREKKFPSIVIICQKYARRFIAVVRVRKLKAAQKIVIAYKKSKWAKFFNTFTESFEGIEKREDFGKAIEWPSVHLKSLETGSSMMYDIWRNWWAKKMITSIPEENRQKYRILCKKHSIFESNKQCDYRSNFVGDYVDKWISQYAPDFLPAYNSFKKRFLSNPENGQKLLFSCPVNKSSRSGKTLTRYLILTEKTLTLVSPSFSQRKKPRSILDIHQINMTHAKDHLVILNREFDEIRGDADLILDFSPGINAVKGDPYEKYSEFVVTLQLAFKRYRNKLVARMSTRQYRKSGIQKRLKLEFFDDNLGVDLPNTSGLLLHLENMQNHAKPVPCDGQVIFAKRKNIISAKICAI